MSPKKKPVDMTTDELIAASDFALQELAYIRSINSRLDDKAYRMLTSVFTFTGLVITASAIFLSRANFSPNITLICFSAFIALLASFLFIVIFVNLFKFEAPKIGLMTDIREYFITIQEDINTFVQNIIEANAAIENEVKYNNDKAELIRITRMWIILYLICCILLIVFLALSIVI